MKTSSKLFRCLTGVWNRLWMPNINFKKRNEGVYIPLLRASKWPLELLAKASSFKICESCWASYFSNPIFGKKKPMVWKVYEYPTVKIINPFVPNAPFLYPLKTSEKFRVFLCFQEVENGCIGNKRVKML